MKKRLFRTVIACFLAGVALTWVGCSNYDDEIDDLNNRIDELTTGKLASIESQQTSLQSALDNLRGADTALGQRIDDLKSQIGQSGSGVTAEDLKKLEDAQASLQSSIEAIEGKLEKLKNAATQDWVTATLEAYATTQEVGKITAAIEALGKFTTEKAIQDAIDAAKNAAITAAGEAFETSFQTSFDAAFAKASAGFVNNEQVQGKIDAALTTYDAKVKELIKAAVANDGEIDKAIAEKLAAATADMKKFVSARLTSVQLIPELYEAGIETIELKSFAYNKRTVTSSTTAEKVVKGSTTYTTSQAATEVRYLVSPSMIKTDDIEKPSFVFENAETRAAVTKELVQVADFKIQNGVLTVGVKKDATTSLKPASGTIFTAALKVPIAKAHLAKDEGAAAVYSDFVKLTETSIVPEIAALTDKNASANKPKENKFECTATTHFHFSADYTAAQAANASEVAAYNDRINLSKMVTGCYTDGTTVKELSKQTLKDAGLEFRFAVPQKPYTIGANKTDQQQFISVAEGEDGDWYATSKLPAGTADNQAAIDKTPIVRVELVDTQNNNAVVDVRYFKVIWQRTVIKPVDFGIIKTFDHTLSCADFVGEFNWDEMIEKILSKLNNGEGMSYNEFKTTYQGAKADIASDDHKVGNIVSANGQAPATVVIGTAANEVAHNFDAQDQSTSALAWKLTAEQIGEVISELQKGNKVTKTVTVTVPAVNPYHGSMTFKFEVNIKLPTLPAINGYDETFWQVNYSVANIYPVQYNTPTAQGTCEYNYELDRLFADSKIVKNLLPCGKWDLQFAEKDQPNGYKAPFTGGKEPAGNNDTKGYSLQKGTETAVTLNFNSMGNNWYAPATTNAGAVNTAAAADITVKVECNNAGKGILGQEAKLNVWAALNDYNRFVVSTFKVHFVEPLKINTELTNAHFVDQIISGSEIDCSKAFTMTDFKDYIVAKVTTGTSEKEKYADKLYGYYAVVDPVWNLAGAKTNLKKDAQGNYVVDETITAANATIKAEDRFGVDCITLSTDGQKLVFKNINGVKVEKKVKLFIPVTVEHKWGTLTENVIVDIYPEEPSK